MRRVVWRAAGIAALFLLTIFGSRGVLVEASPMTKVTVRVQTQYGEAYDALKVVNKARKAAGLKPLVMDKTLLCNALTRAQECSAYYAHRRADGREWHTAITKGYTYAGENIGFGFDTAEDIVAAWLDSPSHRKNIMNSKYTCVGIGCVVVDSVTYWAQEFTDGRANKVSRPVDKVKKARIAVAGDFLSAERAQGTLRLNAGDSRRVSLVLENAGYEGLTVQVAASGVKYFTSDRSVVTVTSSGKIQAVRPGRANVKVSLAGNGRICRVYKVMVAE